jgi:hypothetical protein
MPVTAAVPAEALGFQMVPYESRHRIADHGYEHDENICQH